MKNKFWYILKFAVFSLLFFLLSRASLQGEVFPFAFGMLFALAWVGQKVWLLSPAYLLGCIANNYSFEGIITSVVTVSLLCIPYYIHIVTKKPMRKWELFVFAFIGQMPYIAFSIISKISPILYISHILIGLGIMWLEMVVFEAFIVRGFSSKLTRIEMISLASVVMITLCGVESCDIYGFSFLKVIVSFLILAISHIYSPSAALIFASVAGLGGALGTNNPLYVTPFILYTLAVIVFKRNNKFYSAISIILVEVLSTYYFNLTYGAGYLSLIAVVVGSIAFLCIPQKVYNGMAVLFNRDYERMAVKNLLNRNREAMQRRLERLGEVFFEMNVVFKKLIRKNASEEEVKEMLYEELKNSICKGCSDHKHCHRTFNEDTKKIFIQLISIALTKGRITLLDFPNYLSSRCVKANVLIAEINTLTQQYKSYRALVGNIDTSKLLISDQLEGVAGIMKNLSKEVDSMISVDSGKEKKLIEELASFNIVCVDAIIYQKDAWTEMATLVVRSEDSDKLKIQEVVSKVCKNKMCIYDVRPTEKAGLVSVELKTSPAYDCVFGLAAIPKGGSNVSGDKHCVERLDGDKFIFAICDGMGHGESAGEKSDTAINLIENFYKAGFDSEIILSSVNKLLNLEGDDIFSTIDVCVVDLKNGIADFVKMGASTSYIRGEEGCEIFENKSLPVGVIENVKADTQKVVVRNNDYIILCSDGINDAFASDLEFRDFLLSLKSKNPQEQADQILEKALSSNNGFAVDDMTVLVVKIFNQAIN